ncbi:MAG: hypothetical protein RIS21_483, partial [Planctomycetota bacterium]
LGHCGKPRRNSDSSEKRQPCAWIARRWSSVHAKHGRPVDFPKSRHGRLLRTEASRKSPSPLRGVGPTRSMGKPETTLVASWRTVVTRVASARFRSLRFVRLAALKRTRKKVAKSVFRNLPKQVPKRPQNAKIMEVMSVRGSEARGSVYGGAHSCGNPAPIEGRRPAP